MTNENNAVGGNVLAAAYCRVSTKRQAENELSIAEQQAAINEYAIKNGLRIVNTYVDAGITGTTDRRPELQRLIRDAAAKPVPFSTVLVYSTSRFFRNANESAAYRLKLAKRGIRVISVTQDFGQGPEAELAMQLVCAVDQYSSSINSSQVRLVMAANAEAGYWNGSRAPLGYAVAVAGQIGQKQKKKLVVDDGEAEIVKRIFNQYVIGENGSGPMGLKAIASKLNNEGMNLRGKRFITSTISDILRRETYTGTHYYNVRDSKAGTIRPRDEWIAISVPAIVPQALFDAAQERLARNQPAQTAPRRVNSPTLLAQLGRCGLCGSALLLVTGKGGRYRYLTCSTRRTMSSTACVLRNFRLTDVDDAVIAALEQKILQPERLQLLLAGLLEKSDQATADRRQRLSRLRSALTESKGALARIWDAIEAGAASPHDPNIRGRLESRNRDIRSIEEQIRTVQAQDQDAPKLAITDHVLARFAELMREGLRSDNPNLRKGYLQMLVSEVRLSNSALTIRGAKNHLETVIAKTAGEGGTLVPTFAGNWRARNDSNVRPSDS